ncbi:MAG: nuclear transport factor 2 family protein [Bacteroidota bacterium]
METIQIRFDQHQKSHWTDQETKNVRLLIDFVQQLMNNHDFEQVLKEFNNSRYRQHNRSIPDGMEALVKYVADFAKRYPDYTYDVKHIHADGDIVIFHSHITTSKKDRGDDSKGINVSDTWRVENGQIVEHWDSLQPINGFLRFLFWVIGGKVANRNGVF